MLPSDSENRLLERQSRASSCEPAEEGHEVRPENQDVYPVSPRLWLPRDDTLGAGSPSRRTIVTHRDLCILHSLIKNTMFERYDPASAIRDRHVFTALQSTADDYLQSLKDYGIIERAHVQSNEQRAIVLKHRRVLVDDLHYRLKRTNEALVTKMLRTMDETATGGTHDATATFFALSYRVAMDAFLVKWCALRWLLMPDPCTLQDSQQGVKLSDDESCAHDEDLRMAITQTETTLADLAWERMAEKDHDAERFRRRMSDEGGRGHLDEWKEDELALERREEDGERRKKRSKCGESDQREISLAYTGSGRRTRHWNQRQRSHQ